MAGAKQLYWSIDEGFFTTQLKVFEQKGACVPEVCYTSLGLPALTHKGKGSHHADGLLKTGFLGLSPMSDSVDNGLKSQSLQFLSWLCGSCWSQVHVLKIRFYVLRK